MHCNKCFSWNHPWQRQVVPQAFWIGQCGHVTCDRCVRTSSSSAPGRIQQLQCAFCRDAVEMIQLEGDIPEPVEKTFAPVDMLLEELTRVVQFQQANSVGLIESLKKSTLVYKQKYLDAQQRIHQLESEIRHMKQHNGPFARRQVEHDQHQRMSMRPDSRLSNSSRSSTNVILNAPRQTQRPASSASFHFHSSTNRTFTPTTKALNR